MNRFARAVVCWALTLAGGGAFAQVNAADASFQRFYAQVTGVGKQTIGYGSGGQLVVGQGVPQISTAGGPVLVDRALPLGNNSGGQISANARISVPPAALGRILVRGMGAVSVLGAGIALYDVANELGFLVSKDGSGALQVGAVQPGACVTPGGCTGYRWDSSTFGSVGPSTNPAGSAACPGFVGRTAPHTYFGASHTYTATAASSPTGIDCNITYVSTAGSCCGGFAPAGRVSVPMAYNPSATTPSTAQALEDAVAAKSGWPSGSRVSQAVADSTALEPAPPFTAIPQVTGPATSTGTTSTTSNPDGSTTTTTTTHNHTYAGPTINTTTQTVTSTCTGGSCNTTTTTETPKLDEQPFAMPCGVSGTPACAVKVDETGMPTAESVDGARLRDLEDDNRAWIDGLVAANPFPDINWAFELPTACGVIPTPAFAPAMESVDVCQFQPIFHDVMSVVWVLGGLFGAISLFMRNALTT
jgi:hypothetical protein